MRALAAVLVLCGLGWWADSPDDGTMPRAAATHSTGALRICSACGAWSPGLARGRYVILQAWNWELIPRLKRERPGVQALVYENLSFVASEACSRPGPGGVGWCEARRHLSWFVRDRAGARIASAGYPYLWLMDVGSPSYERRWLAHVAADARAHGWDGVFVDDVDADLSAHLAGRTPARYPTAQAWQAATRRMLARVGPPLRRRGLLVVGNLAVPWSPAYDAKAVWRDWLGFLSGASQEYFTKWGTAGGPRFAGADWAFRQEFQRVTERAGKAFLGIAYAPRGDTRSALYARATFLLNLRGARSALLVSRGAGVAGAPSGGPWAADVGTPVGPRRPVGRAWRRAFTRGIVVVNASEAPARVPLGGWYLDRRRRLVRSVRLAPATGAILRSQVNAPLTG